MEERRWVTALLAVSEHVGPHRSNTPRACTQRRSWFVPDGGGDVDYCVG